MKIFILTFCIVGFFISQFYVMADHSNFAKKLEVVIEDQLKILNTITMDKVDTNFQLEDLENKIKELEK